MRLWLGMIISSLTRQAALWSKVWMYQWTMLASIFFLKWPQIYVALPSYYPNPSLGKMADWPLLEGFKIWKFVKYLQLHPDSSETVAQSLRKVQGVMFQNMIPEPKKKAGRGVGTCGEGKGTAFRSAVFVSTLSVNQLVVKLGFEQDFGEGTRRGTATRGPFGFTEPHFLRQNCHCWRTLSWVWK